jgi:hypothetical protein
MRTRLLRPIIDGVRTLSGENSRANHQNVLEDSCGRSNGRHQLPSFLAKEWQKITYDRKVSQPFSRQTSLSTLSSLDIVTPG